MSETNNRPVVVDENSPPYIWVYNTQTLWVKIGDKYLSHAELEKKNTNTDSLIMGLSGHLIREIMPRRQRYRGVERCSSAL